MLHTVNGPVGKLRSLTYRLIPFLAAEVRSGSGKWQIDYAISSALCQLKAADFVKETWIHDLNASAQKSFKVTDFCVGQYTSIALWFPMYTTRTVSISKVGRRKHYVPSLITNVEWNPDYRKTSLYQTWIQGANGIYKLTLPTPMYRYSNYITNMPDLYVLQTLPVWPCLTHSIQPLQNYGGPRFLYPPIPQVLFPQVHALSLQCRSISGYSTGKQRSLHLNH